LSLTAPASHIYTNQTVSTKPSKKVFGKCKICGKDTILRCSVCRLVYYCGIEHQSKDYKEGHKQSCQKPVEEVVPSPAVPATIPACPPSIIDLNDDFFDAIYKTMSMKYVGNGRVGAVKGYEPFCIKFASGQKHYCVREIKVPMTLDQYKQLFLTKRFTENDFWEFYSVGKSALLHNAIIFAMVEMVQEFNVRFTFRGDPVSYFGTVNVSVEKPYTDIVPTYDWESENPSDWVRDTTAQSPEHKVIIIRVQKPNLKDPLSFIWDFTAPQYGIHDKRTTKDGFKQPFFSKPANLLTEYKLGESISALEVQASIKKQLAQVSRTIDLFPVAVDSYKITLMTLFKELRDTSSAIYKKYMT
jgi:predicted RNA-binding Zn-ribbon protein involved in translation (DUF1610 family)